MTVDRWQGCIEANVKAEIALVIDYSNAEEFKTELEELIARYAL